MAIDGGPRAGDADGFRLALERMLADAAAAEAARERTQERHLREAATAEATFLGVAVDLAEGQVATIVRTSAGRSHRGLLLAVGRDVVVVRDGDGPPVMLALAAVTSLRPFEVSNAGVRDAAGARPAPLDVSFAGLVARLAAERPRVQVAVAGDDPITGDVRAVGVDVVTLRLDGVGRPLLHLRVDALVEVVLLDL